MATTFEIFVGQNSSDVWTTEIPITPESIELTLIDCRSGSVINSRQKQDVLDQNNCSFSDGVFRWEIQPADNIILMDIPPQTYERHLATFSFIWASGSRALHRELVLSVRRFRECPTGLPE